MKLLIVSVIIISVMGSIGLSESFADHAEVTIEPMPSSSTTGCQDTPEGCYNPMIATVDVGGKVIFSNTNNVAHVFASGTIKEHTDEFDSNLIQSGKSFEWTPTEVGEVPYFCYVHPWMSGTIIVQDDDQNPTDHNSSTLGIISIDDDPIIGNPDAPINIIEFSDFQCPFCARFNAETLPLLIEEYIDSGKVKLVYRDFPLHNIHPNAVPAAVAAECADEQDSFKMMHDLIFDRQSEWSNVSVDEAVALFSAYATTINLDQEEFDSCLFSGRYVEEIGNDLNDGRSYGIDGTPGFLIGNDDLGYVTLSGAQPFEVFQQIIDSQLNNISPHPPSTLKPLSTAEQLHELRKQLDEKSNMINDLNDDVEYWKLMYNNIVKDQSQSNSISAIKISDLESQLSKTIDRANTLEDKRENLKEKKDEWKNKHQKFKENLRIAFNTDTKTKEHLTQLAESCKDVRTELSELQSRFTILETNSTQTQSQLNEALFTIEKLTTELNEAKKKIEELKSQ